MKKQLIKFVYSLSFLFFSTSTFAQSESSTSPNFLVYTLIGVGVIFVLGALLTLADNLLQLEAKKAGADTKEGDYGIFPTLTSMFSSKKPEFIDGDNYHKFTKGFDINLKGGSSQIIEDADVSRFAIKPPNFIGISPIPKVEVEIGDEVKAGDPIFYDKKKPEIIYSAPVSGEVVAINRGQKRSIAEIVILADKDQKYKIFDLPNIEECSREELVKFLSGSGAWPLINQRPFDTVADTSIVPKNIFISTFDTAPLAPNANVIISGRGDDFQKGLDVLSKLTSGKVVLGINASSKEASAPEFNNASNVEKHYFAGKHPAGNVGIQIHNTYPIKAGDKVWTLSIQEVLTLGKLFTQGVIDSSRVVAVTGEGFENPKYLKTNIGASVKDLVKDNLSGEDIRLVSGDILSGKSLGEDDYVNFRDDQITGVKEGAEYEMLGWLNPFKQLPSVSGTYPNFLYKGQEFKVNTNTNGEKRAFVMTGQYESVLPMDILPQHLMKSILTNDIEKMEGLGILELSEEDLALCEYVCTSKMPLQSILRDGLEMLRSQE